jgi:hypothetical protein
MGEVEGVSHSEYAAEVYCRVASFVDEEVASFTRRWLQEVVDSTDCQLAVFHFPMRSFPHVAVIGTRVNVDLDHYLEGVLSLGEATSLPEPVIQQLRGRLRPSVDDILAEKPGELG